MATKRKENTRLSGWVRLWIVLTALCWLAGGFDLAFSTQSFEALLPLSDASPKSIRIMLWFLGPSLVATAWCTTRWIWLGFRAPPNQAAAPYMGVKEIARRVFVLLEKIGLTALMLVWMGGSIVAIVYAGSLSFWLEMLLSITLAFKFFMLMEIWEAE